jgi:membrane protease YdiL (CAAX protease family)
MPGLVSATGAAQEDPAQADRDRSDGSEREPALSRPPQTQSAAGTGWTAGAGIGGLVGFSIAAAEAHVGTSAHRHEPQTPHYQQPSKPCGSPVFHDWPRLKLPGQFASKNAGVQTPLRRYAASADVGRATAFAMRRVPALLLFSLAVELLVLVRPTVTSSEGSVRLFADLGLQTVLFFTLPVAWVRWVFHGRLADVGLTLGRPRQWLGWLGALAALAAPAALWLTRLPSVHHAYPVLSAARTQPWFLVPSTIAFAAFGLAWEFFFRGFLLMGTKSAWGPWAIAIQAVPCALMHIGKPTPEVLAAFPAALFLGVLAYRTGSIVPGLLLHLWVALVVNVGCVFWPLSG